MRDYDAKVGNSGNGKEETNMKGVLKKRVYSYQLRVWFRGWPVSSVG